MGALTYEEHFIPSPRINPNSFPLRMLQGEGCNPVQGEEGLRVRRLFHGQPKKVSGPPERQPVRAFKRNAESVPGRQREADAILG